MNRLALLCVLLMTATGCSLLTQAPRPGAVRDDGKVYAGLERLSVISAQEKRYRAAGFNDTDARVLAERDYARTPRGTAERFGAHR